MYLIFAKNGFRCACCGSTFKEPEVHEYTQTSECFGFPATETICESFCPVCGDDCIEEIPEEED